MLVNVENENYGYSVATHDDWVVVGNPASYRFNLNTASFLRTGSVDIFKYKTLSDQHDHLLTLYKPISAGDELILSADSGSEFIHTDTYRDFWMPVVSYISGAYNLSWKNVIDRNRPIRIDALEYSTTYEDDYGHSLDVYNNILAIGSRWHNQRVDVAGRTFYVTGSSVDIFNLNVLNSNPLDGYISTGSAFLANVIVPSASSEPISGSFGYSVSINDEWLAVGSPSANNTVGRVYLYRRTYPRNPDNFDFTYFTAITGSSGVVGDYFGHAIDINKQTGSYSHSLVVGCGNDTTTGSRAYYFEFNGTQWAEQYVFSADRTLHKLPFYDINPITRCDGYSVDGFGNSVALFGKDIAIGAPTDRWIYEYSGSRAYKQGACYIYNKCSTAARGWNLIKKFYGNDATLKNNKLGFSVDIWDDKLIVGSPKSNLESMGSCYTAGSVFQENYCYSNLENYINGQWILFQKNTSSSDIDWDILNVYQRKKRFLSPYRGFGYDVAIANKSVVIGAPMLLSDSNREFNIINTGSREGDNVINLESLTGKSYIYNLKNFRDEFHVGNVFYRNGKVVLNTSGSVFEGMWFNPVNELNYEYEIHFDSKQTIYEKQFTCVVEPGEFNVSTNPTALVAQTVTFDINNNGRFDWQDMDVILSYMQRLNTRYDSTGPITDWTSSLLTEEDEISYYNFFSANTPYYNTGSDYSSSFFSILNVIGNEYLDFNQDSKIDINDMNIFWKYCSNRLTQTNYQSYITPNSKRKLFSDIIDHLNTTTNKNVASVTKPEFFTFASQSLTDKTGSYLAPYVTTIGLYSGLDLVAVAKLGSPIKLNGDFPINFIVKMDF